MLPRKLELLSPASNADSAIQAILHGADAVYIGPPSHGARKSVSNSIEDIEKVVDFAHQYRAKVYATVNTIVYDSEIKAVENLCRDLYTIGVDALIVQDMGILRMKMPPIALHASTQCDIRTPEKAKFLEDVGFSQLVLARELTLNEIREITETVNIPVETFVHGALCVCYSGRCHASQVLTGRSANRGECAQICRLPFSLIDASGKIISKNKYLLSLKDFNASHNLKDLIEAGVSSFKIEGRLKDMGYVKNITALYNQQLNRIVSNSHGELKRSSYGQIDLKFIPQADKSFNRGFTNYFLEQRKPLKIANFLSPKSQGELIHDVSDLNNGDGISYFDKDNNFTGVNINKIEGNKIIPARNVKIPEGVKIYRTSDIKWEKVIKGETSTRKMALKIELDDSGVSARDERGVEVRLPMLTEFEKANKTPDYRSIFEKLGNTPFYLKEFNSKLDPEKFFRASGLTSLKRGIIDGLSSANKSTYPFEYRRPEKLNAKFPYSSLDFRDNVANEKAKEFYKSHGVENIEEAIEVSGKKEKSTVVMTTRHCVLRELGMCIKEKGKPANFRLPLNLLYDGGKFQLDFDCKNCEMKVKLP